MSDQAGKVAIVTGSTKGIGLAIAEHLARAGASVVVTSRTETDVKRTAERLNAAGGGRVEGIVCDVRDPESCAELVERTVQTFGRLDVLVNNAGVGVYAPLGELSIADWQLQIETNLGGAFYCATAALPHLSASGDGFIVNIGSLAGRYPMAGGVAYNASKFGLIGMSEAMMLDIRYQDVRVSLVMPGSVNTHFQGRTPAAQRDWRLEADDCALAVMQILSYPREAHVSRVEMRPSQPRKG